MSDDDERESEADHSDLGKDRETGTGGYAEEQPGDASPETNAPAREDSGDKPGAKPSSPDEGDPEQATGNPGAAG